jgi:hypothetical protein
MMRSMRPCPSLGVIAWLLALPALLPACSTQDLGPTPVTFTALWPDADRGGLMIAWAPPADTYEQYQASASTGGNSTLYCAFMDGRQLAYETEGVAFPHTFPEVTMATLGFLPAGMHHFEIAVAGGGATVFSGEGEILPGSTTRLYLFGPRGARQGRFVSFPSKPAPDTVHVSVTNLIRNGQRIEVVSCDDATTCTPLSPPLAVGETYDADFPGSRAPEFSDRYYVFADGAEIGLRQVPTAMLPNPPVEVLFLPGISLDPDPAALVPPANLVAAPIYMSADGRILSFYN